MFENMTIFWIMVNLIKMKLWQFPVFCFVIIQLLSFQIKISGRDVFYLSDACAFSYGDRRRLHRVGFPRTAAGAGNGKKSPLISNYFILGRTWWWGGYLWSPSTKRDSTMSVTFCNILTSFSRPVSKCTACHTLEDENCWPNKGEPGLKP